MRGRATASASALRDGNAAAPNEEDHDVVVEPARVALLRLQLLLGGLELHQRVHGELRHPADEEAEEAGEEDLEQHGERISITRTTP